MTKDKPLSATIKRIPQRTCISCRKTGGKRELIRLVNVSEAGVEVDPTGKKSGRGAYLCPHQTCWDNALKTGSLAKTLRTNISSDNKTRLQNYSAFFQNEHTQV